MIEAADGRAIVAIVREAARRHGAVWEAMVPDRFTVDLTIEAAEEQAYAEMAGAKARLRDHICATYGITARELASLAQG